MKTTLLLLGLLLLRPDPEFLDDFTGQTLRLDLYHTGNRAQEWISLEGARVEGAWAGSRTRLLDRSGRGKYQFEVRAAADDRLLYSRGFASIFGEWETTPEAQDAAVYTLPEALRFPEPRAPFVVRLFKRDAAQQFQEIWRTPIDPAARSIKRAPPPPHPFEVLQENGDPAVKVDLLFLGDGYTAAQRERFLAAARAGSAALFDHEPFRARREDFNVRALLLPADEPGISRPRAGVFRNNPLGTSYNIFDSERYVLTLDDRAWRDAAAAAPHDCVVILCNERQYGGGGIYNLYATAAADSAFAGYLVVHEFGHSFAGLADEYFTSPVSYEEVPGPAVEPWEPNVTALLAPPRLKWHDLVTPGTPVPTPWNHDEFTTLSRQLQDERARLRAEGAAEEVLEDLFRREQAQMTPLLSGSGQGGVVGAFEGALYQARGLYRPAADCVMFTRDDVGFCAVCRQALEQTIDQYTR